MNQEQTMIKRFFKKLSSLFLNGLFTILPLTLTISIFAFSFKLLKDWLRPIQYCIPQALMRIPHSEIVLVLLFILLMGAILKVFVLRSLIHTVENNIITKIPLIRPIYTGIKQLVNAFSPQDTLSFKKVVLIEFPRSGVYSVGFVTSEVPSQLVPATSSQPFFCVFVPTTPNPTTGYFIFLAQEDVIAVDLTRQEAMALIISGGIIQPERFTKV